LRQEKKIRHRQTNRETDRQTDRQTDRHRQTDRQRDRQTDRETHTHRHTHTGTHTRRILMESGGDKKLPLSIRKSPGFVGNISISTQQFGGHQSERENDL
jgi:hypothetical protein